MTVPFPTNTVGWELARLGRMRWVYLVRTLVVLIAVWNLGFEWLMGTFSGSGTSDWSFLPMASVFLIAFTGPLFCTFGSLPFLRAGRSLELLVLAEGGFWHYFLRRMGTAAWHIGCLMVLCLSLSYIGRDPSGDFLGIVVYYYAAALYMTMAMFLTAWYLTAAPSRWGCAVCCGALLFLPLLPWSYVPVDGAAIPALAVGAAVLACIAYRAPNAMEESQRVRSRGGRRPQRPIHALLGSTQPLVPLGDGLAPWVRMVLALVVLMAVGMSCIALGQLYLIAAMGLVLFHVVRRFGAAELDDLRLASISPRLVARHLYVQYLARTFPLVLAGSVCNIRYAFVTGSIPEATSPLLMASLDTVIFVTDWLLMVALGLMTAMSSEKTASRVGTALLGLVVVRGFAVSFVSILVGLLILTVSTGGDIANSAMIAESQLVAQPFILILLAWYYWGRFAQSLRHYWETGVLTREPPAQRRTVEAAA